MNTEGNVGNVLKRGVCYLIGHLVIISCELLVPGVTDGVEGAVDGSVGKKN